MTSSRRFEPLVDETRPDREALRLAVASAIGASYGIVGPKAWAAADNVLALIPAPHRLAATNGHEPKSPPEPLRLGNLDRRILAVVDPLQRGPDVRMQCVRLVREAQRQSEVDTEAAPHPQGGTEDYWRRLAKAHMDKSDDLADQVESLTADLEAARGLIGRVKSFRDEVATEADTAEERAVLESLDALLAAAPAPTDPLRTDQVAQWDAPDAPDLTGRLTDTEADAPAPTEAGEQ